jgi:hypothetical protein
MGNNYDPVTLHKYLYANADPGNMIDPSGNFSMGSMMSAINVMGRLATTALNTYSNVTFLIDVAKGEVSATDLAFMYLASRVSPAKAFKCRNSFVNGTLVHTGIGLVSIESLKIGDLVWTFNEELGVTELKEVTHLIIGEGDKDLVGIKIEGASKSIVSTSEHPFFLWETKEWLDAGLLNADYQLENILGLSEAIDSSVHFREKTKVYNLTVDGNHNYYVGENGILVHNAGGCKPPGLDVTHVLSGHVRVNKFGTRFTGWHHRPGGLNLSGNIIIPGTVRKGPGGFFEAQVARDIGGKTVLKTVNGKKAKQIGSSFFPDDWSRSKVIGLIKTAATYGTGGKDGKFDVPLSKILPNAAGVGGVRIKGVISGGKVVQAYPDW